MQKKQAIAEFDLICTMGTEPQVVTIVLDQLLSHGYLIKRAFLIYTMESQVIKAINQVYEEMAISYPKIECVDIIVQDERGFVGDFRNEDDLKALLHTLYKQIRSIQETNTSIHLCISGGRKVMGILAMVAAQLLFTPKDQVWHLVTEGWHPGSEKKLHLSSEDEVWLVPVPVLRMNDTNLLMQTVTEVGGVESLVEWQVRLENNAQMKRRREFIQHWLTKSEKDILNLVCQGLDNTEIAVLLGKKQQTIANQLTPIFEKYREWKELWDVNIDRARLVAEFAPYYTLLSHDKE